MLGLSAGLGSQALAVHFLPSQHLYKRPGVVPVYLAASVINSGREEGQEVVTDRKAEEHKVVDNVLEVEPNVHLGRQGGALKLEVLSQQRDKNQLEVF